MASGSVGKALEVRVWMEIWAERGWGQEGPYIAWTVDMVKRLSDAVWPELASVRSDDNLWKRGGVWDIESERQRQTERQIHRKGDRELSYE